MTLLRTATSRTSPYLTAAALAVALLVPTAATAQSSPGGALALPGGAAAPADPQSGGTISAPIGPNTIQPPPGGVLVRRPAVIRGQLTAAAARRTVLIQLLDPARGWTNVAKALAGPTGTFSASWSARHIGRFQLRAIAAGSASASSLNDAPTTVVDVLRPVVATFFGPGMYGSRTACGQTLTPVLLGVAHRSLPCGTLVDLAYGGRTITVPVVDRGPYTAGVTYDLTAATAQALGIDGTAHLGALALHR